jgi:MFS family permease
VQKSALPPAVVHTDIPFRLDRLPLSRFHFLVVVGLGITWILDGLEVTIVGSLGPALQSAQTLHLSSANLGAVASFYIVGAVTGAVGFGWITDRFGRRLVFYVTLIVYLTGVLLSALAWDFWSFASFRMLTGLGIGGEYAAVNSAIDELIPAKYRGRIDLIVNGSFWLGAAAGALASPVLLDQNLLPVNVGRRLGFGIGGVLGLSILMLRRFVPESPRWLEPISKSPEQDDEAGELDEAEEVLGIVFPAHQDTTLPLQPGKEALDQPAPCVSTQTAAVLGWRLHAIGAVRRDQLDAILAQAVVKRVAVVGAITDKIFRFGFDQVEIEA